MSNSPINPPKYRSGHYDPFYIQYKYRPIGGRLKNHSDQLEAVLRFTFLPTSEESKKIAKFSFYFVSNYHQRYYL